MENVRFFDLKPGITLPALRVRSVALMTNGDVRLYYDDDETVVVKDADPTMTQKQLDDAAKHLGKESNDPALRKLDMVEATGDALAAIARHDASISEKRRLERDMASGPGSKRSK